MTSDLEPYEVRIIANPAAGRDERFFGVVSAAFGDADIRWNIDVTNGPGEEAALTARAIAEGATTVVAFGGDGTVSAVAEALVGTDAVLGILPGGTANVFARELGIPDDIEGAARLLAGPHAIRAVDVGMATFPDGTKRAFTLRVAAGLEADLVEKSSREMKAKLGQLAYVLTALRQMPNPPIARYTIVDDSGGEVSSDGLFAVLTNSRMLGMGELAYGDDVRVDDGVVDGIIAPSAVGELVSTAAAVVAGSPEPELVRLSGPVLELRSEPAQTVTVDGELCGTTPVRVQVMPSAVRVIAPAVTG